ncbi:MAG: YncE family protein, partial [Pyrinomonadaceae bacterium]
MHLLKLGKALLVFLPLAAILGISNWANILAEKMPDLSSPSDEVSNTDSVMRIDLDANEIIFNPHDQTLYATRPSRIGEMGNSLTRINPYNGEIGPSVFVGSEPSLMALSDDGQAMYVALDGAYAIRRYDVATHTPGLQFSIGRGQSVNASDAPFRASDIAVLPGDPNTLAVARSNPGMSPSGVGVAVFDNGVRRPLTGPGHSDGANYLAFASPTTLYGGGHTGGLRTMTVGPVGVIDQVSMSSFAVRRLKLVGTKSFYGLGH